jgi:hypothetical protein
MAQFSVAEVQNLSLGQNGSIFVSGTTACTSSRGAFVMIQFLEDSVFASGSGGLVAYWEDEFDLWQAMGDVWEQQN